MMEIKENWQGGEPVKKDKHQPREEITGDAFEAVQKALAPLDRLATSLERKWGGVDRLASLVSPEMAAKFGSAQDKLNLAIRMNDPDEVAKRASVMVRGWQALDKAATEAGAAKLVPSCIGARHNGQSYIIVTDESCVVSVAELLEAYKIIKYRIAGVKEAFKGARLIRARADGPNDPLPF
jgi:hypothetical protein